MTIKELLSLENGVRVSILNQPRFIVGKATIKLDNGSEYVWIYDEDGGFLSVNAADEELAFFDFIEEDLELEDESFLFRGAEFQFNYEDAGAVEESDGDADPEEGDRYMFSDYTSDDNEIIREIKNENTGESGYYFGQVVLEDEISDL